MSASELLASLESRGVRVWADRERIHLDADRGVLSDADRDAVKLIKPAMLALLTRPAMGTLRCPRTVWGVRLTACPYHSCGERLERLGASNIYYCPKDGNYFELVPEEIGE